MSPTEPREITAPERVRARCPRCEWHSPWSWIDDGTNAMWFAKQKASNAFHDHHRAVHETSTSPIWEAV